MTYRGNIQMCFGVGLFNHVQSFSTCQSLYPRCRSVYRQQCYNVAKM